MPAAFYVEYPPAEDISNIIFRNFKLALSVQETIVCRYARAFFSPFTVSEGGHVRANCSFDLCVMPPTAVHSRDATRTEIDSWE